MGRLIDYITLFTLFRTPYPYIAIIVIFLMVLLALGLFMKIQNGMFGKLFFFGILISCLYTITSLMSWDKPGGGPELDDKEVSVIGCTDKGVRIETGEIITPAGIRIPARIRRYYCDPKPKMREVINNSKVKLEWSQAMEGYRVICSNGEELGEVLVREGLAKADSLASDTIRDLEREAHEQKKGLWAKVRRGGVRANDTKIEYIADVTIIAMLFVFVLVGLWGRKVELYE